MSMLGGIEAGGTKFVCGVGTGPGDLYCESFPTTTPEETVGSIIGFFERRGGDDLRAVGIGSFGPVDLDPNSAQYGYITSTPKPGWRDYDLGGSVRKALGVPVGFDTDVNAAMIGEARWGAVRGLSEALYLTIGTGVGGGALVRGRVVHGLTHPEMGHLRIPHDLTRDPYPGICPFHGDCLEGLACGPAVNARWGILGKDLPDAHPAWELEAHYVALGLVNIALTISPQRIVLGGGVMQRSHVLALVRKEFLKLLNGYIVHESITARIDEFIVPPQLKEFSGVLGSIALAEQALADRRA